MKKWPQKYEATEVNESSNNNIIVAKLNKAEAHSDDGDGELYYTMSNCECEEQKKNTNSRFTMSRSPLCSLCKLTFLPTDTIHNCGRRLLHAHCTRMCNIPVWGVTLTRKRKSSEVNYVDTELAHAWMVEAAAAAWDSRSWPFLQNYSDRNKYFACCTFWHFRHRKLKPFNRIVDTRLWPDANCIDKCCNLRSLSFSSFCWSSLVFHFIKLRNKRNRFSHSQSFTQQVKHRSLILQLIQVVWIRLLFTGGALHDKWIEWKEINGDLYSDKNRQQQPQRVDSSHRQNKQNKHARRPYHNILIVLLHFAPADRRINFFFGFCVYQLSLSLWLCTQWLTALNTSARQSRRIRNQWITVHKNTKKRENLWPQNVELSE